MPISMQWNAIVRWTQQEVKDLWHIWDISDLIDQNEQDPVFLLLVSSKWVLEEDWLPFKLGGRLILRTLWGGTEIPAHFDLYSSASGWLFLLQRVLIWSLQRKSISSEEEQPTWGKEWRSKWGEDPVSPLKLKKFVTFFNNSTTEMISDVLKM